ncbi:MAG: VWA domain-containing protein, partial [Phycisphaerae bacterium]
PPPEEAAPPLPPPPPPRPSADFFAVKSGPAARIVYVVDRSGSMMDSLDFVKYELKRSICALAEEQLFDVIFYSSGPPVEMPPRRFADATERNKQLAVEFIDSVFAQGETDPSGALERAFALQPDAIYLLTDGEFDSAIVGLVKRLNADGQVKVHTICFLYDLGEKLLKEIAAQNGGQYKFVSEKDLPDLVKRGDL